MSPSVSCLLSRPLKLVPLSRQMVSTYLKLLFEPIVGDLSLWRGHNACIADEQRQRQPTGVEVGNKGPDAIKRGKVK